MERESECAGGLWGWLYFIHVRNLKMVFSILVNLWRVSVITMD